MKTGDFLECALSNRLPRVSFEFLLSASLDHAKQRRRLQSFDVWKCCDTKEVLQGLNSTGRISFLTVQDYADNADESSALNSHRR